MSRRSASLASLLRPSLLGALAVLLVLAFSATGCKRFKRDKDPEEGMPVEQIYERAHEQMRNGNWNGAQNTFKRLVAQYPYGPYTEQALVESAYAYYKMGNHEEAVSTVDRFIRTYPTHANVAYMYYLRGLANGNRDTVFLQQVWSLDPSRRDLATPTQAYNDFAIVAERYPNSRYAGDARQRMIYLRNRFAQHELETALYYLRRNAWVAAATRARYLLETYPQSEYQNDAVAALAIAYDRLGNETLAQDATRVLRQNEPNHPYLTAEWPKYPWRIRRLNPFAGERNPTDMRRRAAD